MRGYCLTARPEQRSVEQGDAHGPHSHGRERCQAGRHIRFGVAIERQVGGKVAPRIATAVLDLLAQKRLEDLSRRARQHEESE
eukprot:7389237-Prymnesium_polylepis.1